MSDLTAKVAAPARTDINVGLSPCHQATMLSLIGKPGAMTADCSDVTNAKLKAMIVTESVGPFRVTGHQTAVLSLRHIFEFVLKARNDLYIGVATEGMLCCRQSKGGANFSNHSWGLAIDLRFGELDQFGSAQCAQGILDLYPFFHAARWYWGSGFPTRDSMHFEPSDDLVRWWDRAGMLI